jgi:hypothetical protein
MTRVLFIDTSVLCEIVAVPGKSQRPDEVARVLEEYETAGIQLVLPIATVIETGNHIAQAVDGQARRSCAERFCNLLRATATGRAPWVLHSVSWDERMIRLLCDGLPTTGSFVDLAGAGVLGTGDLSILAESELFAARTAHLEVGVWTHDEKLSAYAG